MSMRPSLDVTNACNGSMKSPSSNKCVEAVIVFVEGILIHFLILFNMSTRAYLAASFTIVVQAAFRGSESPFVLHAMVQGEARPIHLRYNTIEHYENNTVGFYNHLEAQRDGDVTQLFDYPYNMTVPQVSPVPIQWKYDFSVGKLRVMNADELNISFLADTTPRDFCLTITSNLEFYAIDDCSALTATDHVRTAIQYPAHWVQYYRRDGKNDMNVSTSCMGFKSHFYNDVDSYDRISAKCFKAGGDISSYFFKEIPVRSR